LVVLLHFNINGYPTINLVGGATGSVGDPSFRSSERVLLSRDLVSRNSEKLELQLVHLRRNMLNYAQNRTLVRHAEHSIVNNFDWLRTVSLLDFLSTVGTRSRINSMLARDSVKSRLATGISFTEFTYQLLQAYDFWHLYSKLGCDMQVGGSDQWGNITAGTELIRKFLLDSDVELHPLVKAKPTPHGLTFPLITTPSGDKFGKSEGNAVWLDKELLSVFDFYQVYCLTSFSGRRRM
jgi:tyrosyl-tRNA synthetase